MTFAVFDPSPYTVCINCSFFYLFPLSFGLPVHAFILLRWFVSVKNGKRKEEKEEEEE